MTSISFGPKSAAEHIAYPDHVFVAADDDFIRDMGGSNDDVSPIQLGFVFPTAQLLTE